MVFLIFLVAPLSLVLMAHLMSCWQMARRRSRIAPIVQEHRTYPNNHHVLGVGYYHAADGRWWGVPWNEFREGQGYFWGNEWRAEPDRRIVTESTPSAAELQRVNQAWRRTGCPRAEAFWQTVERSGFGTAVYRQEGS